MRGVYHVKTGRRMRKSSTLREVRLGSPLDEGLTEVDAKVWKSIVIYLRNLCFVANKY